MCHVGEVRNISWLAGVVAEMRRLGVTELQDRQRRVILGPEPAEPSLLIGHQQEHLEPDPDQDLYSATGLVPLNLRELVK